MDYSTGFADFISGRRRNRGEPYDRDFRAKRRLDDGLSDGVYLRGNGIMAKKGGGDGIILIAVAAVAYFLLGGRGAYGGGAGGGGGGNGSLDGGDAGYTAPTPYAIQWSGGPEIFAGTNYSDAVSLLGGTTYQDAPSGWSNLDWEDFVAGN